MRLKTPVLTLILAAPIAFAAPPAPSPAPHADHEEGMAAPAALKDLMDGNLRYVKGQSVCGTHDPARRTQVAAGQHPKAIVLGCADSRVPPEVLFDEGLGDLFVIREAGNTADGFTVASMEYAVEHLGTKLIVVLGHERCGAVQAALAPGDPGGHLGALVAPIRALIPKDHPMDLDALVRVNVLAVAEGLRHNEPILAHAAGVQVVGARYDLDTGEVEVLK